MLTTPRTDISGTWSGWLPTERHTLQVKTVAKPAPGQADEDIPRFANVYALGDTTDLPLSKAGSTAHFEAPIVAERIAAQIGHPLAFRAVGRANATNPMPLVIPCHRVIGTDGKLHGYGGGEGLPTKEWLLTLEGARIA